MRVTKDNVVVVVLSIGENYPVMNPRPLHLSDALCDPHDVSYLLLLELEVRVEDPVMKLFLKGVPAQAHLLVVPKLVKHLIPAVAHLKPRGERVRDREKGTETRG